MSEMKGYDGAAWQGIFTPKTYGLDDDGAGTANQFNNFTGLIKRWDGAAWVIEWPPGASGGSVNLIWGSQTTPSISDLSIVPADASASITLVSDGSSTKVGIGIVEQWLSTISAGSGSSYEVRQVAVSGSAFTGPTAFATLASNQSFSLTNNSGSASTLTGVANIEIQPVGNAGARQTLQLTLTAQQTL